MKITIQNGELEQKVGIALKGINGRNSTRPILKCIIIKAKEDEILLEATNLEIGLRVKVDGTVEEEGCCAIDGKSLADISRKMPDGNVVIQSDEKGCDIREKGEDQAASQRCRELPRTSGSDRNGSKLQRVAGNVKRCLKWGTIFHCGHRSESNAVGGTC